MLFAERCARHHDVYLVPCTEEPIRHSQERRQALLCATSLVLRRKFILTVPQLTTDWMLPQPPVPRVQERGPLVASRYV